MAGFTDTWKIKIIDQFIGNIPTAAPTNIYIGLSTTIINSAGGNLTEPSAGAYARVTTVNNSTNWPSGNPKVNGVTITFPRATSAWGLIQSFFLSDHLTSVAAVNIIGYGNLTTPLTVNASNQPSFGVGALRVRLITT